MKITRTQTVNSLFKEIAKIISESKDTVIKSVNSALVINNYLVGKQIVEFEQSGKPRADYAAKTLTQLSIKLTKQFHKGFSVDNLENMRMFYMVYRKSETVSRKSKSHAVAVPKVNLPSFQLSWSHYILLMKMSEAERGFYEIESVSQNWSVRELQRQYNSALYDRLSVSKSKSKIKALSKRGHVVATIHDALKEPYILEFLELKEEHEYSETDLEKAIIDKLQEFMLELGKGFLFAGRQVRFTFDEEHYFVDLVFYNRLLKCFVLFDLKIGKIKHQDIGQMGMYVNYYDRAVKTNEEHPTIGIILCKQKNNAMVEMTLPKNNNQIFARMYQSFLPSKNQLIAQIKKIK